MPQIVVESERATQRGEYWPMSQKSLYNNGMHTDLILGTAGHIDHGKTSLVRALTGVDTDRLPEEKERGITIEPGFAKLQVGSYSLGIVDVPGHERFIRQMLSGATGMDLVALVIAANESIKPQTKEHFEILRLLDLPAGVIVITKCDLVDDDWLELVEEEIRGMVADSFLASAPIVRTSATTGMGLDRLKQILEDTAARVIEHRNRNRIRAPFRMAIDRSFSVVGHGAVVTGSVATGSVDVGASLSVEPGGHLVRVRSLQNHDQPVSTVYRGQRAAINIAGLDHSQIVRGQEIAVPGHLEPSRTMTVLLHLLSTAPRPLKDRARVRFHLGTADLVANIRLFQSGPLEPGKSSLAQTFLSELAVATNLQPFVIRAESPAATIGGGRIIDPNAQRLPHPTDEDLARLSDWASEDEDRRLAAAIYFAPAGSWRLEAAARLASVIDPGPSLERLKMAGEIVELQVSPSQTSLVHVRAIQQIADRIREALAHLHDEQPLRIDFALAPLEQRFAYLPFKALFDAALRQLLESQTAVRVGSNRALTGRGPQLNKNERRLLDELVQRIQAGGIEPPDKNQLREASPRNKESISNLLALAVAAGDLHAVTDDLYRQALADIQQRIRSQFKDGQGFTVSQLRELLGTSRKYAVPLAEYLDKIGFTRRQSDLRFLREQTAT
jgi:selenocysteine-specific elongation factor